VTTHETSTISIKQLVYPQTIPLKIGIVFFKQRIKEEKLPVGILLK